MATAQHAGELLRDWRLRRNLSQLDLASRSAISARHLSFVETGRSRASREMILHLAQRLEVPLRDRNRLLVAGGFAPIFAERPLGDDALALARSAVERFLAAHAPYPAVALDRAWTIVAANDAVAWLTEDVAPELLEPPVNALRATLHPQGMAPRIVNFDEWSGHLLERLRRELELTASADLRALYDEVVAYPNVRTEPLDSDPARDVLLPLRLRLGERELAFFSTVTTFGTACDVTLDELSIEAFYPVDDVTAAALRG